VVGLTYDGDGIDPKPRRRSLVTAEAYLKSHGQIQSEKRLARALAIYVRLLATYAPRPINQRGFVFQKLGYKMQPIHHRNAKLLRQAVILERREAAALGLRGLKPKRLLLKEQEIPSHGMLPYRADQRENTPMTPSKNASSATSFIETPEETDAYLRSLAARASKKTFEQLVAEGSEVVAVERISLEDVAEALGARPIGKARKGYFR
jgi:hypothetical protein